MKLRSPLRGLESREGKVHPLRRNLLLHLVLDRLFSHSGSARAPKRRHYSLDVSVLACPSTQQVRRPSQQLPHRVRCRLSTLLRSLLRFRLRGDTLVRVQIRVRLAGPNRIGGGVGSSLVRGSRLALRGCTATRLASPGTRAGYRESARAGASRLVSGLASSTGRRRAAAAAAGRACHPSRWRQRAFLGPFQAAMKRASVEKPAIKRNRGQVLSSANHKSPSISRASNPRRAVGGRMFQSSSAAK